MIKRKMAVSRDKTLVEILTLGGVSVWVLESDLDSGAAPDLPTCVTLGSP